MSGWQDLLDSLRSTLRTTEDLNRAQLIKILSSYQSQESDWTQYVEFDEARYTRRPVDGVKGVYELLVLAWEPGQGSSVHGHGHSMCFVKVLAGELLEKRYRTPGDGENLSQVRRYSRVRDKVSYIEHCLGVHEMRNESGARAVSLHLYVPPLETCMSYDRRTSNPLVLPPLSLLRDLYTSDSSDSSEE